MTTSPNMSAEKNQEFSYEADHYDRRFLDCWRRQAAVFLEKCGADIDYLFFDCLPTTDQIFEEHIVKQNPKYAFPTSALNDEGLSLIGWKQDAKKYETFEDAKSDIVEHFEKNSFAIIMGSVFYFPHCPEYKLDHLNHSIVLLHENAESIWEIVDDDSASTLSRYHYHNSYISDYFNNNGSRTVRYFSKNKNYTNAQMQSSSVSKCKAHFASFEEKHTLLKSIKEIACNPYESLEIRAKKIHEAFSIYSGSRSLFSRFSDRVLKDSKSAATLQTCATEAMLIKHAMIKAEITGRFNLDSLSSRCQRLLDLEIQSISSLRKTLDKS